MMYIMIVDKEALIVCKMLLIDTNNHTKASRKIMKVQFYTNNLTLVLN